jgi:polyvinyl alcohol dehydrogenase (cytochrome)
VIRATLLTAALALAAFAARPAAAQTPEPPPVAAHGDPSGEPPGKAVYDRFCASCHAVPEFTRAPELSSLRGQSEAALRSVMTEGVMRPQAAMLTAQQLDDVVAWLAAPAVDPAWATAMACPADRRAVDLSAPASFTRIGVDGAATRSLSAAQAGLAKADIGRLELDFAVGFPETTGLRSGGVIVGDTLFYTPVSTRKVLALDARSGCARWVHDHDSALRTSMAYGRLGPDGPMGLVMADTRGRLLALDAATGRQLYLVEARHDPNVLTTGSPVLHDGIVIVPISAGDAGQAADDRFECCKTSGAVAAFDAATGRRLWLWRTMEEAKPTGAVNAAGTPLWGPSGAPIWSTPTIDGDRRLVYVTSGENTSLPATVTSDAVIALDLDTGEQRWVFQALENDVWNMACSRRTPGANCPPPELSVRRDHDFGAGVILASLPDGRDVVIAGQKSSDVWALDADTGEKVWHAKLSPGSALGGVHWALASDGRRVYVPLNDPVFPTPPGAPAPAPGMYALDLATGALVWSWRVEPACGERQARAPACSRLFGLSAAPLLIDGALIAATIDGRVYAFDAETGEVIFETDTLRDYDTVNGVAARGGAIDSHSIFAGDGALFIASGYGLFGQPPGNVLLAFRPGGR